MPPTYVILGVAGAIIDGAHPENGNGELKACGGISCAEAY